MAHKNRLALAKYLEQGSTALDILTSPREFLSEKQIWVIAFALLGNADYCAALEAEIAEERKESEIVDGFHRYTIIKTHKDIYDREGGKLPVVVIDKPLENRMASTIRHNRARGSHSIELMSNIVSELVQSGMSDAWIIKNIGMDRDELLRLKQLTGLAALFANKEFSIAEN